MRLIKAFNSWSRSMKMIWSQSTKNNMVQKMNLLDFAILATKGYNLCILMNFYRVLQTKVKRSFFLIWWQKCESFLLYVGHMLKCSQLVSILTGCWIGETFFNTRFKKSFNKKSIWFDLPLIALNLMWIP